VSFCIFDIIHLLHVGEGNMKMYSPKSIIFPEGNMILVGEYIFIFPEPACYKCFIIPNETKKTGLLISWILVKVHRVRPTVLPSVSPGGGLGCVLSIGSLSLCQGKPALEMDFGIEFLFLLVRCLTHRADILRTTTSSM
jgi:hypothetical protein